MEATIEHLDVRRAMTERVSKAAVCVLFSMMCLNTMNAQSHDSLVTTPIRNGVEAKIDKPLQAELLKIYKDDQQYRQKSDSIAKVYGRQSIEMNNLRKTIRETDSINVAKVKAIIDRYGWVGPDKIGEEANRAIWAVIQHADSATQATYLPVMREAVKQGNASASQLALLEDRVALRAGKRQIYGTQLKQLPETGELYVPSLDDPDNVDKRRAEVGLGTLAEYLKSWGITWNVEEYKKKFPELAKQQ